MQQGENLFVVMPCHNEEESLSHVLDEWVKELRNLHIHFRFVVVDDGSTDQSFHIAKSFQKQNPEIILISGEGRGHGSACVHGYKTALDRGAQWVFQIDSDGQCDPRFFPSFWKERHLYPVQFGYRKTRDDGRLRWILSRFLSLVCFLRLGLWLKDPNVPYRLMRKDFLSASLKDFRECDLANAVIASRLRKTGALNWKDIHFLERSGGRSSLKLSRLPMRLVHLWKDLS